MPTLNWIGKDKVVTHHQDVPFKILEHQFGFTAENGESKTETNSGNKIIHGDNLEALKSLLPEYEGKIKCIYIDPPYNTGNESCVSYRKKPAAQIAHLVFANAKSQTQKTKRAISCQRSTEIVEENVNLKLNKKDRKIICQH